MTQFAYIVEKIAKAKFSETPFRHIFIDRFFSDEHFDEITKAQEVNVPITVSDELMFEQLFCAGYKIIDFPGCIADKKEYLGWHKTKSKSKHTHTACEGFGLTLRLMEPRTELMCRLNEFLQGEEFNGALADKFGIRLKECLIDGGIQKYLDGYEISPHPDVRRKALTFMVNINPHKTSEHLTHHTHYLKFKDEYRYVQEFWASNHEAERCWVPWDWCKTESVQTQNNSMVIFSPSNDTLHGVKANYDHLAGQRTQLYGNIWYSEAKDLQRIEWEDLDVFRSATQRSSTPIPVRQRISSRIPTFVKQFVKRNGNSDGNSELTKRNVE
jgi:hypothetical protein